MPLIYFLKNSMEIPKTHDGIRVNYHKQLQTCNELENNAYSFGPYGNLIWIPTWIRDNFMDCHVRIIAYLKLVYEHCGILYVNLSNFNGYLAYLNK
jgi:hypothetical protein